MRNMFPAIWQIVFCLGGAGALFLCALDPVRADVPRVEERVESAVVSAKTLAAIEKALDEAEEASRRGSEKPASGRVGAEGVSFFVSKVRLETNLLFTQEKLAPFCLPFEGKMQTMASMQTLAEQITAEYRRNGYLSSQAYIPPQEIKDGVFTIAVLEGRVGRVVFEGNRRYSTAVLRRYCDVQEGDFFSYQDIQRSIAKMNAQADRTVQAIVRQGEAPGRTDVIFKVEEKGALHGSLFADNQGSDPVGKNRLGLGLRYNNLLGQDDVLRMGTMAGKNFNSVYAEHALPVAGLHSVWKMGVSFARSTPKKQYSPYGVISKTLGYWGRMETRLITEETLSLDWKTGLDFKHSETVLLAATSSRERLRVLRSGPVLTLRDGWGATVIENQFSLGLDALGAEIYSQSTAQRRVTPDFFVSELKVSRIQRMPLSTRLSLKGRLHLSPDTQPSSEQLSLGGADTVRGYPDGEYFADQGILINAEYLVPMFFLPNSWNMPWTKNRMRDALEMALFWDSGYGRYKDPAKGQKASERLTGTGVGVRARLSDAIYFTTDFAYAIGARPSGGEDDFRIHSSMQANF